MGFLALSHLKAYRLSPRCEMWYQRITEVRSREAPEDDFAVAQGDYYQSESRDDPKCFRRIRLIYLSYQAPGMDGHPLGGESFIGLPLQGATGKAECPHCPRRFSGTPTLQRRNIRRHVFECQSNAARFSCLLPGCGTSTKDLEIQHGWNYPPTPSVPESLINM